MTRTTLNVDKAIADGVRELAKKHGMKLQDYVEMCLSVSSIANAPDSPLTMEAASSFAGFVAAWHKMDPQQYTETAFRRIVFADFLRIVMTTPGGLPLSGPPTTVDAVGSLLPSDSRPSPEPAQDNSAESLLQTT